VLLPVVRPSRAEEDALPRGAKLAAAASRKLTGAITTPGFNADAGEAIPVGTDYLLLGLGKKDELDLATLRTIGAKLVKALDRGKAKAALLAFEKAIPTTVASASLAGRCIAEGMGLANWRVDFFDGTATKTPDANPGLSINTNDAKFKAGLKDGLTLAECANESRRISATPPNICNPTWMAAESRKLAKKYGLTCRVINFTEAKRLGMGGLVNVGKASSSKPCMIILEHKPARPRKGVKLALIGKTLTYDTGGYSLKISNGMKGMKYDKNGGCAVLGAMLAIASLKVPVHVVAVLPAAENMVNGDAYRPDDIITMYNGVTCEVTNTDAEGRLVLADALAYTCKKLKPTHIVDAATLTGGVVVALGEWCAGVWCDDDDLLKRLNSAADTTGERIWQLPLWEEHRKFMRSKHADIWNSAPKRGAHPIQGAAFLSYFVDEYMPWAHVDIAGVSDVEGDRDLYVTGPTGFGVRLMTELAAGFTA